MGAMKKALDLFCCQGGATRGLQRAGYHVTGVDSKPQPRYCGDAFHQADALTFPLDGYDLIWASPPCQAWSTLRALQGDKEYPELIVPVRQRLEESGTHWVMENVEGAPLGQSGFLIVLCGTMFGLGTSDGSAELRRHRLFETSFSIPLRPQCQHGTGVIYVHGDHARDRRRLPSISVAGKTAWAQDKGSVITVTGHTPVEPRSRAKNRDRKTFSTVEAGIAMGIDWMTMKGLSQAIPPAYAEFIARRVPGAQE